PKKTEDLATANAFAAVPPPERSAHRRQPGQRAPPEETDQQRGQGRQREIRPAARGVSRDLRRGCKTSPAEQAPEMVTHCFERRAGRRIVCAGRSRRTVRLGDGRRIARRTGRLQRGEGPG